MTSLNELLLIRDQYRYVRKTAITDFRNSSYVVPFTSDVFGPIYATTFSKGFVGHTGSGGIIRGPNSTVYSIFIDGIKNNNIDNINLVCDGNRRLVDPYCLFDNEIYGPYKSSYDVVPTYSPTSPEAGAELVELYCMSLMRDVALYLLDDKYPYPNLTAQNYIENIISYMNQPNIKNYLNAPLDGGNITRKVLFRGDTSGDLIGPYMSQFNYYVLGYGQLIISQKYQTYNIQDLNIFDNEYFWTGTGGFSPVVPGWNGYPNKVYANDFIKTVPKFISLWNGGSANEAPFIHSGFVHSNNLRYLTTIRDTAMYIYRDQVWQPFFTAATILLNNPILDNSGNIIGYGVPVGFYFQPRTATKFVDLGPVDLFSLLSLSTKLAMNATWLWKWRQLKLRPEEMAYQVHLKKTTGTGIDFNSNLMNSQVLTDVSNNNNGNFLLPLVYTVGSPCHPSYPSGHATIAGAMSTILKAWFNCDSSMNAVTINTNVFFITDDGLIKYTQDGTFATPQVKLRVDNELDKLASNCSVFRNFAGIHYRSDAYAGLEIGENVAISVLEDWVKRYSTDVIFRFRKRNGTVYEISKTYSGPVSISGNIYFSNPVLLTVNATTGAPAVSGVGELFSDPNNS
jgi:membrane-associated phospholipid phosphatase